MIKTYSRCVENRSYRVAVEAAIGRGSVGSLAVRDGLGGRPSGPVRRGGAEDTRPGGA